MCPEDSIESAYSSLRIYGSTRCIHETKYGGDKIGETCTRSAFELLPRFFHSGAGGIRTHNLVVENDVVPPAFNRRMFNPQRENCQKATISTRVLAACCGEWDSNPLVANVLPVSIRLMSSRRKMPLPFRGDGVESPFPESESGGLPVGRSASAENRGGDGTTDRQC